MAFSLSTYASSRMRIRRSRREQLPTLPYAAVSFPSISFAPASMGVAFAQGSSELRHAGPTLQPPHGGDHPGRPSSRVRRGSRLGACPRSRSGSAPHAPAVPGARGRAGSRASGTHREGPVALLRAAPRDRGATSARLRGAARARCGGPLGATPADREAPLRERGSRRAQADRPPSSAAVPDRGPATGRPGSIGAIAGGGTAARAAPQTVREHGVSPPSG